MIDTLKILVPIALLAVLGAPVQANETAKFDAHENDQHKTELHSGETRDEHDREKEHLESRPASDGENHADEHAEVGTEKHKEHSNDTKSHAEETVKGSEKHEDDHGKEGKEGKEHAEEGAELQLSNSQIREAGIVVQNVVPKKIALSLVVPGEVQLNRYKTKIITPRIPAMVMSRHVAMGDIVRRGQAMVTLFSVDMAQAQGEFVVARSEWERVQRLGKNIVSAKRTTEAQVKFQQIRALLLAYGLTKRLIEKLPKSGSVPNPGQYDLWADQDGLIVSDSFQVGEVVEPGRPLYRLTDPVSRWVEARINPEDAATISPGDKAVIATGGQRHSGTVIQLHQSVDEQTRTLGIRIEVVDPNSKLRPGQFVDVSFEKPGKTAVLAVPNDAVLRSADGDWTVFQMVAPGKFKPVEIKIIRQTERLSVIEGLPVGAQVAVKGAFFVQSELAKSGFDIHNH